ncbi:hypothetical protein B0E53_00040 [Micromonospora sp. MH33]|uniref:hypothetical protein n=1 Tax=Micromonospora sp. MH33 TaxID=1945509 RepID=UPI000D1479CC|nr:hypothetical protein [Micromonospora sp. MH33]PSK67965.1 hypothetical protein B0E53_00040 [Micromonospora sp. MH33]
MGRLRHQLRTTLDLALLVVTHDLSVPRRLGGDLLVLDGRRTAEPGRVDTVLGGPTSPAT